MKSRVLIFGATSGIARAVAVEFARHGHGLVLLARDPDELAAIAADLSLRHGVPVETHLFDALAYETHPELIARCLDGSTIPVAGAVLCFGYMGDPGRARAEFAEARRTIEVNFLAAVSVLEILAARFEREGTGFLCALSSVAGDRGRQSNYLYGSAKAGLSTYLQGLRNRLTPAGVCVTTIKPGFVDTPMTYGKPGLFLVATPEAAARGIYQAIIRKKDIAYVPWFWWGIMAVIRAIPESLFKRLKL